LPDGPFSNKNLGKLALQVVGIFYDHLVYFAAIWCTYCTAIWYILWSCGIFYGHLVYFPRFGMLYQDKSGNPGFDANQQHFQIIDRLSCKKMLAKKNPRFSGKNCLLLRLKWRKP
jgi:hypothetical protein